MRIIISPAKKMIVDTDTLLPQQLPIFLPKAREIMCTLQHLTPVQLQTLLRCNDALAMLNYQRLRCMDLQTSLTPALLSYEGIQYQYMAPTVFEEEMLSYVEEHLRILSGFYGVLRPMDGITPYRLEMQTKLSIHSYKNLYAYWGNQLYHAVRDESGIFINLASKEYSKCIEPYLQSTDTYISCTFGESINGKVVQKGVYAKMARGEMVRYLAENRITTPEGMRYFNRLGYQYHQELSTNTHYIFLLHNKG